MDRRLALAAALLAAPAFAAAEPAAEKVFFSALDVSVADLTRDSLAIEAPRGAAVVRARQGFPFPIPGDPRDRDRRDRDRGRGPDRRDRSCHGFDNGWEEHWGGHGGRGWGPAQACAECSRRHGRCTYRCTEPAYTCTAAWVPDDGSATREHEGRTRRDRYDAEDSAVDACRDAHWNDRQNGRCRLKDCKETDEVVDSGRCG